MEDQSAALPSGNITQPEINADQPGARAVEALAWTIAQEFIVAMDDFYDTLLNDDESDEAPKALTAGQ